MVTTRMRVFLVALVGVLVLPLSVILFPAAARAGDTEQQIHDIDAQLGDAITSATFIQAGSVDDFLTQFQAQYPPLAQAVKQAASGYQGVAASATGQLKTYADQLAQATNDLSSQLDGMAAAISAQSSDQLQSSFTGFQGAVHQYLSAAGAYNTYIKANPSIDHPLLTVYLALFIASLVLTAGALAFWLMAKAPPGDLAADRIKALRLRIVLVSLFPVAGSGITYFWYRHALTSGGHYVVLYGPVALGFIAFLAWIGRYRTTVARLRAQPPALAGGPQFQYPAPPGQYPAPPGQYPAPPPPSAPSGYGFNPYSGRSEGPGGGPSNPEGR